MPETKIAKQFILMNKWIKWIKEIADTNDIFEKGVVDYKNYYSLKYI